MPAALPFCREAGAGPAVVCLHANASTSSQWRDLTERLSGRRRVLAPDGCGAGRSPDRDASEHPFSLGDEVDFLEPVLASAGASFDLVGHSYGAAAALVAARRRPERVRRLVLYEPTLFAVLDASGPPPHALDGIRAVVQASAAALDRGDRPAAARHFIDYWMGEGSWDAMPPPRQAPIADSIVHVRRWARALMTEPTPAAAFAALDMPVLYLLGEKSPAPAHAVARALLPVLPRARAVELPGLGHMAPVTHPEVVNAEIVRFLEEA